MALFESYERRIDQINAELNKHGIQSLEEAKQICDDKGIDVYNLVKSIQPICFENACWAYMKPVRLLPLKKAAQRLPTRLKKLGLGFSLSVSPALLQTTERLALAMVTWAQCSFVTKQNALHFWLDTSLLQRLRAQLVWQEVPTRQEKKI